MLMLNVLFSAVLGALRMNGVKPEAFQVVAHVYVGGLFTLVGVLFWSHNPLAWSYLTIFVILCGVEVFCFVTSHRKA